MEIFSNVFLIAMQNEIILSFVDSLPYLFNNLYGDRLGRSSHTDKYHSLLQSNKEPVNFFPTLNIINCSEFVTELNNYKNLKQL